MTTRKTTALIVGILLGIAVSVVIVFVAPRPLVLVRLRDDFSVRTFMKDDPKEPIPTEEANVFYAPADERVERTTEPEPPPPPRMKPPRHPDPRDMPRTRPGAAVPLR